MAFGIPLYTKEKGVWCGRILVNDRHSILDGLYHLANMEGLAEESVETACK